MRKGEKLAEYINSQFNYLFEGYYSTLIKKFKEMSDEEFDKILNQEDAVL